MMMMRRRRRRRSWKPLMQLAIFVCIFMIKRFTYSCT
jgi:hypothetical protein